MQAIQFLKSEQNFLRHFSCYLKRWLAAKHMLNLQFGISLLFVFALFLVICPNLDNIFRPLACCFLRTYTDSISLPKINGKHIITLSFITLIDCVYLIHLDENSKRFLSHHFFSSVFLFSPSSHAYVHIIKYVCMYVLTYICIHVNRIVYGYGRHVVFCLSVQLPPLFKDF